MATFHPLLKPKHTIRKLLIYLLCRIRIIRIRMMTIEELHNMKATPIDVEMNIPFLEIRRDSIPNRHLWMQALHCAPCGIADPFAVNTRRHKQQVKIATFSVHLYDNTADRLAVLHDPVCLTAVD